MPKITDLSRLYEMARILRDAPGNEQLANVSLHDIAKIIFDQIISKKENPMTNSDFSPLKPAEVALRRNLFNRMAEGGTWDIPRSGMIFHKLDGALVLMTQMPWNKDMPISRKQFEEQQRHEFEATRRNFGAAGIPVIKNDLT
jgi:hypothetical protein